MTSSNEHGVTGDTIPTSPRDRVDRDYLASALDAVDWDGVGIPTADVHVWDLADQIIAWATEKTGDDGKHGDRHTATCGCDDKAGDAE